jgi:hypothetical protein
MHQFSLVLFGVSVLFGFGERETSGLAFQATILLFVNMPSL